MKNRLPIIKSQKKICIICEGFEEYDYLNKLNELNLWNKNYDIKLENSKGNGNLVAMYQDKFQNDSYDLVLIFCDTDRKPYEQYSDIKTKINNFHDNNVANLIIVFGNPCTMQIVLLHWCDIELSSSAKSVNAPIIKKYTGVLNYKGRGDQRQMIVNQITVGNFYEMYRRLSSLSDDDHIIPSTNFKKLIDDLRNPDFSWIYIISNEL